MTGSCLYESNKFEGGGYFALLMILESSLSRTKIIFCSRLTMTIRDVSKTNVLTLFCTYHDETLVFENRQDGGNVEGVCDWFVDTHFTFAKQGDFTLFYNYINHVVENLMNIDSTMVVMVGSFLPTINGS